MEQQMNQEVREQTEAYLAMVHHALEGLARLHGNPRHIGAGMRRTEDGTLFLYFTNPSDGAERPSEIWMPKTMKVRAALLFHSIDIPGESDKDASPHYCRRSRMEAGKWHFTAAVALLKAGRS